MSSKSNNGSQPYGVCTCCGQMSENYKNKNLLEEAVIDEDTTKIDEYDFDSIMDYYDEREENKFVGIIEKDKSINDNDDLD